MLSKKNASKNHYAKAANPQRYISFGISHDALSKN
jgi:hypothetical protein